MAFFRFLDHVEDLLVSSGIFMASLILFGNVVLRYVFNSGWVWAEELARYSIVWIVFIGASICVRRNMHLAVDAVVIRLSSGRQHMVRIGVSVAGIAFSVFLVVYGYLVCFKLYESEQIMPGLEILTVWAYLAIPVGGLLMSVRFMQQCWTAIEHYRRHDASEVVTITDAA